MIGQKKKASPPLSEWEADPLWQQFYREEKVKIGLEPTVASMSPYRSTDATATWCNIAETAHPYVVSLHPDFRDVGPPPDREKAAATPYLLQEWAAMTRAERAAMLKADPSLEEKITAAATLEFNRPLHLPPPLPPLPERMMDRW